MDLPLAQSHIAAKTRSNICSSERHFLTDKMTLDYNILSCGTCNRLQHEWASPIRCVVIEICYLGVSLVSGRVYPPSLVSGRVYTPLTIVSGRVYTSL